jgi:hypothetical protein
VLDPRAPEAIGVMFGVENGAEGVLQIGLISLSFSRQGQDFDLWIPI